MAFVVICRAHGRPGLDGRLPLYVLRDAPARHVHCASDNHLQRRKSSSLPRRAQSVVRPWLSFLSRKFGVFVVRTGTVHARGRLSGLRLGTVQRPSKHIRTSLLVARTSLPLLRADTGQLVDRCLDARLS